MSASVVITRCGLLTPLGDAADTWEAMRAGRRVERQVTVPEGSLAGEAWLDRSIRLALAAAHQAAPASEGREAAALFCATSKGPVLTMLAALDAVRAGRAISLEAARQVALGVGAMGTMVGERLGFEARHTSVAACASGMMALYRAAEGVRHGLWRRALVVAADASIHPLFEGSFARLGVLAPEDERGVRRCEPFEESGKGFFVSEAGAAMWLERAEDARAAGRVPLAEVEKTWIGGDGTGMIAIDGETESLRRGLAACMAGMGRGEAQGGAGGGEPPGRLAFVHAHATGTAHDALERAAIAAVCGEVAGRGAAAIFSHKKWLGHSLGAAGLVGVVLSTMCHGKGETPGGLAVARGARSLTIGQGFGGHIAVVRLRGE